MYVTKHLLAAFFIASLFSHVTLAEQLEAEYSNQLSLASLTEKVYQRLPGKAGEAKYEQLRQANDAVTNTLFAAPAIANLSHYNDAIGSSDGFQEWESGVDLPLWLPGQKQKQQAVSDKIAAELPAYQQQLRLQASGEVRQLLWQVKLAEVQLEQATIAWQTAQKLEQDVEHRVKAGDLPRTEALLASSNTLETLSKKADAAALLKQQLNVYALITGETALPSVVVEEVAQAVDWKQTHPRLLLQDQVIARLQAEMGVAQFDAAVNPNLAVGVRRERGDFDESFNNSLGLGISFAFDDSRFSQPAIAKAGAELADAQVERQALLRELDTRLLTRKQQLASTQEQLALVSKQDATTQQYYQLQKRAFDLGELNLIDLLRSQMLANTSQSRKRELEVQIKQQKAALNQALGVIL
ncbi:Heavy metal RND efflux outer membrane protein, CzcC family [Methylophaga thiooxydans]|uniref:Heavy metal RND efflux outer membrane protein, CzcC family n=1 Tax=Methylophaga thiooxydans TaxID=392484 RepID=A0A0A0BFU2_9GAMM|nr:TolC family protein [Methylophaga thiooxydans]KGM06786.1 Heavy metal RND efflux outer membrane protein, CzcC family [Methylophaga thiooxydans]